MKIIWSSLAITRVNEIIDFISFDKQDAARKWVEQIFDKIERIKQFPYSGRVVPELNRTEIREIIYGNYRFIVTIQPFKPLFFENF